MKPQILAIFVLTVLTATGEDQVQLRTFESLEEVEAHYENQELCFIGELTRYTSYDGKDIVDKEREFTAGMEFRLVWNVGRRRDSYWMHICGEPRFGDVYGPVGGFYAVTMEGNTVTLPGILVVPKDERSENWPWVGCAGRYRFHRIKIESGRSGV